MPTYNRAHMITETIDSILNQTFRDLELIMVDDCSHDNTEKVIGAYPDKRIRYFRHNSGRLIAVNRNYGMLQARGEYIAFCDDDDIWLPDKLERQLLEFDIDGHLGMVCTNGIFFNDTGDLGIMYEDRLSDSAVTLKELLRYNSIITSSVVVKKEVIDDVGGMNTNPVFSSGEDYELWLRIIRKYKILYLKLPLVKYRKQSKHLNPEGFANIKHRREIYRWLLDTNFINRGLYWRLDLYLLVIEFLLRTHTMKLASWLNRLLRYALDLSPGIKRAKKKNNIG